MVSEEQESEMELASEKIPVPPVENSVEEPAEVEDPKPEVPRKKPRKRHKKLHASILRQMEFYFGDANLGKDRFLAKLIAEDPWIDLHIFIKFNKIRNLTRNVSRIAKALKNSTMLSVSEDRTKVRRITPIQSKKNSDECTIYVQRLPPEADHDWISRMFSSYGTIDYISIPKYKNKAIKGFAFVEYKTTEEAQKCIDALRAKGCVLPSQTTPDTLLSITTHEDCNKKIAKESTLKKKVKEEKMEVENDEGSDAKKDKSEAVHSEKKKKKKRSILDENPTVNDESKRLRKKKIASINESDRSDSISNTSKVEKEQKRSKKRKGKNAEGLNVSDENEEINNLSASESDKKQKKIKRKLSTSDSKDPLVQEVKDQSEETCSVQKKQKKADSSGENGSCTETENKEKQTSKEAESEVGNEKSGTKGLKKSQSPGEEKTEKKKKKKRKRKRSNRREEIDAADMGLEIMAKKEWKRLRNKYLDMQKAKMKQLKQHLQRSAWNQRQNVEKIKAEKEDASDKDLVKEEESARFSFTPGVIVRIDMESPCCDTKNFKMELKGSTVKYVDVNEGSNVAFVRCDSAESAKSLVQKSNEERTMVILEGEEEKTYWEKMEKDRKDKIENNIRVKQRGRDKLLKKAEKELAKHIKFDEV